MRPEGCAARFGMRAPGPGRKTSLGAGSCDTPAMTQYTRSAIPGRAQPEDRPLDGELDRMVFGRQQANRAPPEPEADTPPPPRVARKPVPMDDDDALPENLFSERGPRERRKATRRKTDYVRLGDDAAARASDSSKRGPLILVVTLVVIGVFGAVVWNAYSSGLRAPDGGPTPELASAGPFKSRPPVNTSKPAEIDASVFERVEKTPTAAVTQEVRPEAAPEPKPEPAKVEPVKLEPVKPAPVKLESVKAEPVKAVEKAAPAVAASAPKAVAVATATPAAKPVETPAKPATAPAATADEPAPAPALDGAGAYHPAFAASGAYVVQLAAPSTEAAAEAEWARRAKAAPDLLRAAEKRVVKADVNGKTVYRLRAGSFATSADAGAFCGAIKASGGACFIAKK
jgi:hypothetical protein